MPETGRRLPIPGVAMLTGEIGTDGISPLVDRDRALRAREVMAVPTKAERSDTRTLTERITGRPAGAQGGIVTRQAPRPQTQ